MGVENGKEEKRKKIKNKEGGGPQPPRSTQIFGYLATAPDLSHGHPWSLLTLLLLFSYRMATIRASSACTHFCQLLKHQECPFPIPHYKKINHEQLIVVQNAPVSTCNSSIIQHQKFQNAFIFFISFSIPLFFSK